MVNFIVLGIDDVLTCISLIVSVSLHIFSLHDRLEVKVPQRKGRAEVRSNTFLYLDLVPMLCWWPSTELHSSLITKVRWRFCLLLWTYSIGWCKCIVSFCWWGNAPCVCCTNLQVLWLTQLHLVVAFQDLWQLSWTQGAVHFSPSGSEMDNGILKIRRRKCMFELDNLFSQCNSLVFFRLHEKGWTNRRCPTSVWFIFLKAR